MPATEDGLSCASCSSKHMIDFVEQRAFVTARQSTSRAISRSHARLHASQFLKHASFIISCRIKNLATTTALDSFGPVVMDLLEEWRVPLKPISALWPSGVMLSLCFTARNHMSRSVV